MEALPSNKFPDPRPLFCYLSDNIFLLISSYKYIIFYDIKYQYQIEIKYRFFYFNKIRFSRTTIMSFIEVTSIQKIHSWQFFYNFLYIKSTQNFYCKKLKIYIICYGCTTIDIILPKIHHLSAYIIHKCRKYALDTVCKYSRISQDQKKIRQNRVVAVI